MSDDRLVHLPVRAPAWARFVAQDGRGYWRAFEYEPAPIMERWLSPGPAKLLARGLPTRYWRRTLRVLPQLAWTPARSLRRVSPSLARPARRLSKPRA